MNLGILIILAMAVLWALGLFWGAVGGLSKSFTHAPAAIDSSSIKSQQQQTIESTKEKQQKMMDDIKQEIEDRKHQF